jgi:hypothetical protein
MTKTSEFRSKPSEPSISAAAIAVFLPASHTEVPLNRDGLPVTAVTRTGPEACLGRSLPLVRADFHTTNDRWVDSEVLLLGAQATVLDRRTSLDDARDRGGPTFGGLPEGVSHERARCLSGIPAGRETPLSLGHVGRSLYGRPKTR